MCVFVFLVVLFLLHRSRFVDFSDLTLIICYIPSWELTYPPKKGTFEDDFPSPGG